MRRFVLLILIPLAWITSVLAQNKHSLLDTVQLDEIIHFGDLKKYQSGARIERISAEQLDLAQEGGLENVLMRFTPVYIKSNAGGIATIRFRGTSPDHTSVNFGGLNINSMTLGHSNLSNIPAFLFDEISLQYGSSSTVNGSGAIGGALYLGLGSSWTNGYNIKLKTTVGSFGELLTGVKAFAGNGKWESVTRIYQYQKENNFPFNNKYTGDVEQKSAVRDIQEGASIKNRGVLQEINYRIDPHRYFNSYFWIENSWQQVQPNMQTNYYYKGTQEIDNENVRVWTSFTNDKNKIRFKSGLGYVHDMQVFDNIDEQIIGTDRLVTEVSASRDFSSSFGIKSGAKYKYIKPDVHAYADSVIDHESHLDLFLSAFYRINKLKVTLNMRQMFVTDFEAPFTPSLGAEYVFRTSDDSFLKLTGALARSYRVPTFNDRYWGIQGKPDLKPETGNNLELGIKYNQDNGSCRTNFGATLFYMNVKNWIDWRYYGIWKAENVQEVVSKGVEFQSSSCITLGAVETDINASYTFNPVEPVAALDESVPVDRQINYVPVHMGNLSAGIRYKKWRFFTDGQFTGKRFSDDFGAELPAHFIANCGIDYRLRYLKNRFNITLSANNVLNSDYQNEKYYAMPGRNFRLSIVYELKNTKE